MPNTVLEPVTDTTVGNSSGQAVVGVVPAPVTPSAAPVVAPMVSGAAIGVAAGQGGSLSGSPLTSGGVGRPSKLPLVIILLVLALLSAAFLLLGLKLAHINNKLTDQQGQVNDIKNQTVNVSNNGNGISLDDVKNALKQLQDNGELNLQDTPGAAGSSGARGRTGTAGATGATGGSGTAACASGACVSLQSSTPGTQENGNFNISGNGLIGGRGGIGTQNPDATLNVVGAVDTNATTSVGPPPANPSIITLANQSGYEGWAGTAMVKGADGFARIAFFDNNASPTSTVSYIRCQDATCTTKTTQLIDSATYYSDYHSVDTVLGSDGFARIIYLRYSDGSLMLARCTDADCTSPVITTVDSSNYYPGGYGMAIVMGQDDKPRIAAADANTGMLRYYRCTDADCTSPVVNDIEDNSYNNGNIGFSIGTDGFARIAYYGNNDSTLHLARCTDADCTSPVITSVGSNNAYYGISLVFASDGFPRIAFTNSNSGYIDYVVCNDADCTAPTITEFTETSYEGYYVGLALDTSGLPHITAENYDSNNGYPLILINCTSADCTSHDVVNIDADTNNNHYYGYTGAPLFLGSDNYVNIAYDDDGDGNGLRFARYSLIPLTAPTSPTPPISAMHVVGNTTLEGSTTTGDLKPLTSGNINNITLTTIPNTQSNYQGVTAVGMGSDGLPRMAFVANNGPDGEGVYFYKCLNVSCTSSTHTYFSGTSYYPFLSMARGSDGFFRIVRYNDSLPGLTMIRCTNDDCSTNVISDLDSGGYLGYGGTAIQMASDGFPRIAYNDNGNSRIKFLQCTNADCNGNTPVVLNEPQGVYWGEAPTLSMVLGNDGFARIAYTDGTNYYLKLARCTNADCSSVTTTTVDNTHADATYYGVHIALAADGTLRIAYADDTGNELFYARCYDADCTSKRITQLAKHNGDMNGGFGMVLLSDGTPRITYEDDTNSYQYIISCSIDDCSSHSKQLFDGSGSNQSDYGMDMVLGADGYLYLAYTGDGDELLHFARFAVPGNPTNIGSSTASFGQAYVQGVALQNGAILSGEGNQLQVTTNNPGSFAANFYNTGNTSDSHGISVRAGYYEQGFTYFLRAQSNYGGTIGYIADNNGTFALTDVSDRRTKTNIEDTTLQGLDIIKGLNVVDFNRLANPTGPRITGFIAQDVQGVYPQAVTTDPDGLLGINKDAFIPVLVKAVQEQQAQITALQQQLQAGGVPNSGAQLANLTVSHLEVQDLVVNASLKVNGHIITGNKSGTTSIVAEAGANCGGTATVSLSGNDTSGTVTITTAGGSCAAGNLATITFANAYGAVPHVLLTPVGAASAALQAYVGQTAANFIIGTATTPSGSTTYSYNYQIMQ